MKNKIKLKIFYIIFFISNLLTFSVFVYFYFNENLQSENIQIEKQDTILNKKEEEVIETSLSESDKKNYIESNTKQDTKKSYTKTKSS